MKHYINEEDALTCKEMVAALEAALASEKKKRQEVEQEVERLAGNISKTPSWLEYKRRTYKAEAQNADLSAKLAEAEKKLKAMEAAANKPLKSWLKACAEVDRILAERTKERDDFNAALSEVREALAVYTTALGGSELERTRLLAENREMGARVISAEAALAEARGEVERLREAAEDCYRYLTHASKNNLLPEGAVQAVFMLTKALAPKPDPAPKKGEVK